MRRAWVEKTWRVREQAYQLRFDDGTVITATGEHRFLSKRIGARRGDWMMVRDLAVGDSVKRLVRPWFDRNYEDGWMAGFIDGEGCLGAKRRGLDLVLTQRPGVVYDRAAAYLRDGGYAFGEQAIEKETGPLGRLVLSRTEDILRLLGHTRSSRFKDWWEDRGLPGKGNWSTLVAIEPVGEREMVDVQTTSRTFIAEGLVSHNCIQVGASALSARIALYVADILGMNVMYVFPTKSDVSDFSNDRIDGMIQRSEYLQSRLGRTVNQTLLQLGGGNIYWRGSNSKSGLQSAAIDVLILDEYDDLTPKHIPEAERRIAGSLEARIRRLGVPSYPDYGLHNFFEKSDKREWLVRCPENTCKFNGKNHEGGELVHPRGYGWQVVDFFRNIDQERRLAVCEGCRAELDVRDGIWMPQQEARIPGFHVSRLMVPTIYVEAPDGSKALDDIIDASTQRGDYEVQNFWNKDLGLPFEPKEGRVTLESLAAARSIDASWVQKMGYRGGNIVTMGVDVATTRALNVRISEHYDPERGRKRALFVGPVEDEVNGRDAFTQLCDLMDLYGVHMAVIDHEPDGRLARAFAERFNGRAFIHAYSMTARDSVSVDIQQRLVVTHRTRAMDATRKVLAEQRNVLPQNLPGDYVDHMRAPVRKLRENKMGEKVAFYESRSPDDYYHAETYDIVAREVLTIVGEVMEAQREVYTPLDSMMPFRRSTVNDLENDEWRPGPTSDSDWSPGPGGDEDGFSGSMYESWD
jgi:hypothetical protein